MDYMLTLAENQAYFPLSFFLSFTLFFFFFGKKIENEISFLFGLKVC